MPVTQTIGFRQHPRAAFAVEDVRFDLLRITRRDIGGPVVGELTERWARRARVGS